MKFNEQLINAQKVNQSLVCVGLDPDLEKLPEVCKQQNKPFLHFNKSIIDATADIACAFKPQIAYYAAESAEDQLEESIQYIQQKYPQVPVILDAKRGDIGATAKQYAREAFERFNADALTVNPYMGFDTIEPYLEYSDKGVIILCHTSNSGASFMQDKRLQPNGELLFEFVAKEASKLYEQGAQISLVVGATVPNELKKVRDIVGDMPILVPGLGAQGGDLQQTLLNGALANKHKEAKDNQTLSSHLGLVLNSSRGIIYASQEDSFASASREACKEMQEEANRLVQEQQK